MTELLILQAPAVSGPYAAVLRATARRCPAGLTIAGGRPR